MESSDKPPVVALPWFLRLNWLWLLGCDATLVAVGVIIVLLGKQVPHLLQFVSAANLFLLLQSGWLRKVYPPSTALYWYLAYLALDAGTRFAGRGLAVDLCGLLAGTCGVIGAFAFRLHFMRYWHSISGRVLSWSYPLTFFFSVYYFQHKLNQLVGSEGAAMPDPTPASA